MPDPIKLKGQVASLDEVPEVYRARYQQDGEVFRHIDVDIEDITGLKNTVQATRRERDEVLAKYKGIDLDAYNAWLTERDKAAADAAKAQGDWEAREGQLKQLHVRELTSKDEE